MSLFHFAAQNNKMCQKNLLKGQFTEKFHHLDFESDIAYHSEYTAMRLLLQTISK